MDPGKVLLGVIGMLLFFVAMLVYMHHHKEITFAEEGLQECMVVTKAGYAHRVWKKDCP